MWWLLIAFAFGAATGSFLNVCICRIPRGESIVAPPSHCTFCNQFIRWYDNLPLLSYVLLRGKCRSCGSLFSPRYFLIELITACLFTALYREFFMAQEGWQKSLPMWQHAGVLLTYLVLTCALVVASFIDLDLQIIPDRITLPGIALGLGASLALPNLHLPAGPRDPILHFLCQPLMAIQAPPRAESVVACILGALVGGGIVAIAGAMGKVVFRKQAMGGGDVRLMAAIGAVMGWQVAVLVFVAACFIGMVGGLLSLLVSRRSRIPFGPYLSAATVASILFQAKVRGLIETYVRWIQEAI